MGDNDHNLIFVGLVCAVLFVAYFINLSQKTTPTVNVPLELPRMNSDGDHDQFQNGDFVWGTYRPNVYFGVKPRLPDGPVFGLLWFRQYPDKESPKASKFRHYCNSGVGEIDKFGWIRHDGKNFGMQKITEKHMKLTTSFVKRNGGKHGGDWSARISGKPLDTHVDGSPIIVSFMFYILLGKGELNTQAKNGKIDFVTGETGDLGEFRVTFPPSSSSGATKYSYLTLGNITNPNFIQDGLVKNAFHTKWDKTNLYWELPTRNEKNVTLVMFQVTAELPFKFEVMYESGSFKERPNVLKDENLTDSLVHYNDEFDKKFNDVFGLEKKYTEKGVNFAKSTLSNLLGEISYFRGSSRVKTKDGQDVLDYWPASLYTSIPSRTSFPRGFLWNSGFDNILIGYWNPLIAQDIISHWLDLMNMDGWIPREQILGYEALWAVDAKYVVQVNDVANPPSLFLAIETLVDQKSVVDTSYLKRLFPRLKKWFYWLHTTQSGKEPSTYYWRGRNDKETKQVIPLTPASGLDDYPRASHPNDEERHLDLRCWMGYSAGVLSRIAKEIGENTEEFDALHATLTNNELLDKLHWSPDTEMYTDFGLHTDYIILTNTSRITSSPELSFVNAFGYVSLFPVMLKIIDSNSPRLCKVLEDIKNPDLLWTNYGLRSLATNSNFYQRSNTQVDPPYWRGGIWINLNYLTLKGLHFYAHKPGSCQDRALAIYKQLRDNIINNVYKVYHKQGFIYEYYDDNTGEGRGVHPFSGWSALVVAIMAEKF